jgi:hypothetical protein
MRGIVGADSGPTAVIRKRAVWRLPSSSVTSPCRVPSCQCAVVSPPSTDAAAQWHTARQSPVCTALRAAVALSVNSARNDSPVSEPDKSSA